MGANMYGKTSGVRTKEIRVLDKKIASTSRIATAMTRSQTSICLTSVDDAQPIVSPFFLKMISSLLVGMALCEFYDPMV